MTPADDLTSRRHPERPPVRLPVADVDQQSTWHALIELSHARPRDWCIVGGQMVALRRVAWPLSHRS